MATRQNITVNPDFPGARLIIEQITACGKPAEATVIYEGARNTLFYVDAPQLAIHSPNPHRNAFAINVKAFRVPPFPNDYIYATFRAGKAARSYEFARRLTDMGFNTPAPLGYSETNSGLRIAGNIGIWPRLTRSYYFCEQLQFPDMRCWEGRPDRDALIEALGAEIGRLHAAGIWMKDFSTGNILVQPPKDSSDGHYRFHYVDLNRTAFGVKERSRLMQMFKALSCSREITLDIAAAYARATGRDMAQVQAEAGKAFDTFHKRMQRKQRLKALFRSRNRS